MLNRLKELRADFKIVNQADDADPVALLEMNRNDLERSTDSLRKYVDEGGTLILHRVRPEHQAWLAELTGSKVAVERAILPFLGGPADDRKARRPGRGLATSISTGVRTSAAKVLESSGRYRVTAKGRARSSTSSKWNAHRMPVPRWMGEAADGQGADRDRPGEMGSPRKGEERLRQPDARRVDAAEQPGVVQKLPAPKPALPKDVTYVPLDLSKLANVGSVTTRPATASAGATGGRSRTSATSLPATYTRRPFKVAKGDKNAIVLGVFSGSRRVAGQLSREREDSRRQEERRRLDVPAHRRMDQRFESLSAGAKSTTPMARRKSCR